MKKHTENAIKILNEFKTYQKHSTYLDSFSSNHEGSPEHSKLLFLRHQDIKQQYRHDPRRFLHGHRHHHAMQH